MIELVTGIEFVYGLFAGMIVTLVFIGALSLLDEARRRQRIREWRQGLRHEKLKMILEEELPISIVPEEGITTVVR